MAGDMTFRLHHKGEFSTDKFLGGIVENHEGMDLDLVSYSVLMEWVKDLGYKEIGGIYVNDEDEKGWKLLKNDADLNECMLTSKGSDLDLFVDIDVDERMRPMRQMQPHVTVRQKKTPLKAKKRTFVTLKQITQVKDRRLSARKDSGKDTGTPLMGMDEYYQTFAKADDDVEKRVGIESKKLTEGTAGQVDKVVEENGEDMDTGNDTGDEDDNSEEGSGENEDVDDKETAAAQRVHPYELLKLQNIAENKRKMAALGLPTESAKTVQKMGKASKKPSNDQGSEYVCSERDLLRESDADEENGTTSKRKKKEKKVAVGTGPRTRSRASKIVANTEKKTALTISDKQPVAVEPEGNNVPNVPILEKLKSLKNAPGSMAAYLELREREKRDEMEKQAEMGKQAGMEILQSPHEVDHLQSQPDTQPLEPKKKKPRGKSKMSQVHTRGQKKVIRLSKEGQPIADDDDNLLSELSNFLGTTVRDFVSLTCRSWHEVPEKDVLWEYVKDKYDISEDCKGWVMTIMRDQLRGHKCRIKKDHYYKYSTDEERLANRPREVPLKDFKILLDYWKDAKIAKKALTNAATRATFTETHTAGPKSFAQICNKMAIERALSAKPDEPPAPITAADVYLKTRKRKAGRDYKLPADAEEVEKVLKEGKIDEANEMVYGGKERSHNFLVVRLIRKREPKAKGFRTRPPKTTISDPCMESVTKQIREQVEKEMEEKMDAKFMRMMSKLAEKNPGLNVNIEDLISSAEPSNADGGSENDLP